MKRTTETGFMLSASRAELSHFDALNWDDLRLVLILSQERTLRKAAARAGVSAATVLRRVASLEASLGDRLINRTPEGASLTLFGQRALAHIEEMQVPLFQLQRLLADQRGDRTFVSITVTQGLGVNWLIPNAASFHERHPLLGLDFRISNDVADILRFGSDLGVQMTPSLASDVMAIKIGRMHFELFASQTYIDRHGHPRSIEELRKHRFVEQYDGHVGGHLSGLLESVRPSQVTTRVTGSAGAISAIESGLGIGVLPNYSIAFGNQVVALGLPLRNFRDIWLTFRKEVRESPGGSAAITWLKALFDTRKWPCFRDDYVSPAEIPLMRIAAPNT